MVTLSILKISFLVWTILLSMSVLINFIACIFTDNLLLFLLTFLVSLLLWVFSRIFFEFLIVIFSIHESLNSINESLTEKGKKE